MVISALMISFVTSCMYITLVGRFSKKSLYLMNGYSQWVDLFFTVFVIGMAAATATVTSLFISAFTGVFLSVLLILSQRYLGCTRVERIKGTWFKFRLVNIPPVAKLPSWLSAIQNRLPTVDKVSYA